MLGEYIGAGSGTTKLLLHLNGNSTDSSGNGNNGTDMNITYSLANGKLGQGAGTSTNGGIYGTTDLGITGGACTMSIWVKLTAEISANRYRIICQGDAGTEVYNEIVYNYNNGTRRLEFTRNAVGVTGLFVKYNITMGTTLWYNLIYTYDGTNINGYINGSSIGSPVAASGNGRNSNSNDFWGVSAERYNGINYLTGNTINDEVIIENRAWTASEVKKYYTNSLGRF